MKQYLIYAFTFLGLLNSIEAFSQPVTDSLVVNRHCRIILTNLFEDDVIITYSSPDTIKFKTKYKEHSVLRNEIKFVLNPGEEIPEAEEIIPPEVIVPDTSEYCDVYLAEGKLFKEVNLVYTNDTILSVFKKHKLKYINIADIRKINFTAGSGFGKGAVVGGGIGFGIGALLGIMFTGVDFGGGRRDEPFNIYLRNILVGGVVIGIPGALIGGIIGAVSDKDQVYLFPKGYYVAKAKRIKYLIKKHS